MPKRDQMNSINPVLALAPQSVSTGSSLLGLSIDTKGYQSATFAMLLGSLADADATWTVTVMDGDTATQSEHAAVADEFLVGTEALAGIDAADDDNATKKIGYIGGKRYISIEIDNVAANTSAALFAALCILGNPHDQPTSNPPA